MKISYQASTKKANTKTASFGKFYYYFLEFMKGQHKQVFFLSIFGFLCTAFVFFVPRGSSSTEDEGGQS